MGAQHHPRDIRVKSPTEDKATVPSPLPPPSSTATSPSHEFSFTISFHPPLISAPNTNKSNKPTSTSVELAPADDIFLHGHLLPIHHLPPQTSPPRPSDITFENFSLTLDQHVDGGGGQTLKSQPGDHQLQEDTGKNNQRTKSRTFSFFGLGKLRKRNGDDDDGEKQEDIKQQKIKKNKGLFNMSRLLKKYASAIEMLFFLNKGDHKENRDLRRRRPCSFSGHGNRKEHDGWRTKKGQLSAPDSTRTSRTNSGILSAGTAMATFPSSSSDNSTMEELQSAIQAAIAHCKNSVASKQEIHCKC